MRILHVSQYFLPWIGYQEFYLPRAQLNLGHEVLVVSSNLRWALGPYTALREEGAACEMAPGRSVECGIPSLRLKVRANVGGRLFLRGLHEAVHAYQPNVVHSHIYLTFHTYQLARLKRKYGYRLIVDEHQLAHQSVPGLWHRLQRRV